MPASAFLPRSLAAAAGVAAVGGRGRRDRRDARRSPDPGAQSGQAEHHVHDGRLGQHGLGFPAGLRRVGRLRHRALPRRRSSAAARRRRPGGGYTFSQYDPPVQQRELQRRVLRCLGHLPAGQEGGRHRSCRAKARTPRAARRGPPSTTTGSPAIPAPTPAARSISPPRYPDTRLVLEDEPDHDGEADRRRQRIGVPAQRPCVHRRDGERKHDAGDRRRLQLSERVGHVLGHREVQVRQRLHAQRQSVLLHDLAGPVLLGEGRRGLGHDALRERNGIRRPTSTFATAPAAATFDPQAFTRVDIKSAGFLVNGVRRGQSQRPHVCAGDDQFRQLVRVLPHADPVDEGGVRHRVLGARPELARRLPHALGEQHALHERQGLHHARTSRPGSPTSTRSIPNNGTPLPDAMWRIGELFAGNLAGSGLPGATDPLDPVTGKCQPNFHLLSTDGYWNSTLSYTSRGNDDQTVPALANLPGATGFTPGANFPRPYYEGPTATSNSLADLAMYYWIRDLRPAIADKVKDSVAPWQHVTIYGLSIGARGTISYPNGINAITSGTANWPPATGAGGPEAIDDLWHAAVNSRGKYFNASNAQQLAESIVSALADFTDQSGTGTAVGIGGAQLSVTNQYAYKTSYEAGIWGDVKKYALDINTGVLPVDANGNPLNAPLWSAATQLDAQAAVSGAGERLGHAAPHRDDQRCDATPPSRSASPTCPPRSRRRSTPAGASVASPPTAQSVLNFLRGDKSNEGINTTNFRTRSHLLGDIVYSARGAGRRAERALCRQRSDGLAESRLQRVQVGEGGAHADGLRRQQRRNAARDRRQRGERRQGSLGVHSRRRCSAAATRTTRRTRRPPASSSARSRFAAAASRSTRTSSTSTRRRASGTSISRTPTRPRRRRPATTGGRCSSAGSAPAVAPSIALDVTTPIAPPPPFVSTRHRSHRGWKGALGVHRREPGLRLRRADAGQDVRVRLGRAGRVGLQQSRRQGLPLRAQSRTRPRAPASC